MKWAGPTVCELISTLVFILVSGVEEEEEWKRASSFSQDDHEPPDFAQGRLVSGYWRSPGAATAPAVGISPPPPP